WRVEAGEAACEEGVRPADLEAFTPFLAEWQRHHPRPQATIEDVVAHVEHLREGAGVEHIGRGGDDDGTDVLPGGRGAVTGSPRRLPALADRGWSDAGLVALAGGNVLRVLQDAEDVARG